MKTLIQVAVVGALAFFAAFAFAGGGDQSLVSPSQPHAIISTAQPAAPNYYRVKIVWLDGKYLSTNGRRSTLWVSPGKHEIGFRAIINPNKGPRVMLNSATTGQLRDLPTLTLDLKRGYTYYFGAKIPNTAMAYQWQPVLIKTVKSGG